MLTVYLTGDEDSKVASATSSDEVIFLGYSSKQVSGLKLGAIKEIKKIANKYDFKLCIAHRVKPTYVALLATDLLVVSIHHNYNDYTRWPRRLVVDFYKDRLLMLGVSNSVRDDLRRDLASWRPEYIQTLYNHIDVKVAQGKLLTRIEARKQLNLPQGAWVLGSAGRLHHDKDYPTLLRGFAMAMPDLPTGRQLVILGKGPLESELKALAKQLGIGDAVSFLGHVPNGASYFKAFDAFALTSDHEPFGMVLLEAMAARIPIICSDCGGGAEVVDGVGLLFRLANEKQLADCLLSINDVAVGPAMQKVESQFSDAAASKQFKLLVEQDGRFNNIAL